MRDLCAVALGLAMVACDIAAGGVESFQTTAPSKTTKKKKTAPASAPPSPAARAAAARTVDAYLAGSTASPCEQPGARAPRCEQLLRLSSGSEADHPAVHIVHFGDSHTAADEWTGGLRDLFKARYFCRRDPSIETIQQGDVRANCFLGSCRCRCLGCHRPDIHVRPSAGLSILHQGR